ncbi:MAG: SCP2 sterol-binding domain-containing protein [Gammaproteobacteria bacterium]|jgi:ubiquinone biosynthesis protein UbiJ
MKTPVALSAALETALNAWLRVDPEQAAGLGRLEGKVVGLEVRGLGLNLYLFPSARGFQVQGDYTGEPDCMIRATPLALVRLGVARDTAGSMGGDDVVIEGDSTLGQQLREVLQSIEFDWEEALSKAVGDAAAHQVGRAARDIRQWLQRSGESLRQDVTEYLQEESRGLPTRIEVEHFLDEVDTLRTDVDRLEARIARLERERVED